MRRHRRKKKRNEFYFSDPIGNKFHVSDADNSTYENIINYWKNPSDSNSPERYYKPVERSFFLYNYFFDMYCEQDYSILELGCNCGRNLNYLYQHGFKNLSGIEINENAINYAKEIYTEMMEQIYDIPSIYCDSIENKIKEFEDNSFDVVFTFATLQHIHIDMLNYVCNHIQRIANNYICIVEDATNKNRNYRKIFEENFDFCFRMPLHKHINISEKYVMLVFEKNEY